MAVGTLGTSLTTLIDSLNTNQSSLSYISSNISNANTVGYTRRVVSQETKVSDGVAAGVGVVSIRRAVDEFVQSSAQNQVTNVGYSKVKNNYYDRLHNTVLGVPNSSGTIGKSLSNFYTALDSYSNDPSSAVKRTLSINAASTLSTNISNIANQIQTERLNADVQLDSTITELNGILNDLSDLNSAIQQNSTSGGDVNTLFDVRDQKLLRLKEIIGATVSINGIGQASAYINNTEILSPSAKFSVGYERISSIGVLVNDAPIGAIVVNSYDVDGTSLKSTQDLLSASDAAEPIDNLPSGELRALVDIRDDEYPNILSQLDELAYNMIEEFNAVHNLGSGYPPAQSFTGQETFSLDDKYNFTGKFRISVVDALGNPVAGPYGENMVPMTLDFDNFNSSTGYGNASVADIISEINNYFGGQSSPTVNLGPLKDIKLGTVSNSVTSIKASGTLTFSSNPTDGQTIAINGTTITISANPTGTNEVQRGLNLSETLTNIATFLNASNDTNVSQAIYSAGSTILTITNRTSGTTGHSFTFGAGTTTATASSTNLTGGVNASGTFEFDFDLLGLDASGENMSFEVEGVSVDSVSSTYNFDTFTLEPGVRQRTGKYATANDTISVNIPSGLSEGDSFEVEVSVKVTDSDGNISRETITYTVTIPDPEDTITNNRINASSISGSGDAEMASSNITYNLITASLIDADGVEINETGVDGKLKLQSANRNYRIVFDDLSSSMEGEYNTIDPTLTATHRGIGHMFGLNNLFNATTERKNAAINFSIRSDIESDPSKLSSARLTQSTTTGTIKNYTYQIGSSSNSIAQELVRIQNKNVTFSASGGLPELSTTLDAFSTEIYNYATVEANSAESEYTKHELLYDAIQSKLDDIGGVNIDEEMAQTINIQNNYIASAKVLNLIKELFQQLNDLMQ